MDSDDVVVELRPDYLPWPAGGGTSAALIRRTRSPPTDADALSKVDIGTTFNSIGRAPRIQTS